MIPDRDYPDRPLEPHPSWTTITCDSCPREAKIEPGHTLPAGWRSHEYTGHVLCDVCDEEERA